jgi:hypothetical protein
MMAKKWYPNMDRKSILLELQQSVLAARTAKNLIQKDISRLEVFENKIKHLINSTEEAHLFLFQHTFGKSPTASDLIKLGTDVEAWSGVNEVSLMPQFLNRPSGSVWSITNDRAETKEYFALLVRI